MKNKVGVFDSGLGGILILNAIKQTLPKYDYIFYGDTKNLPYGNKTQKQIRELTIKGVEYLVSQGCSLIIIACNTASTTALRFIQQQYLPDYYPDVKVLGVIVPTLEAISKENFPAGLIATKSTVQSKAYEKQLQQLFPNRKLYSQAVPKLATLIENNQIDQAIVEAKKHIELLPKEIKSLILGCTHYPYISKELKALFPKLKIIDQTKIIPKSLKNYLNKHPEIESQLSKSGTLTKYLTK